MVSLAADVAAALALAASAALTLGAATGCARQDRPGPCNRADLGGCVIEEVDVRGNQAIVDGDIEERIATAESAHSFGGALENVPIFSILDSLTVEYERFDRFVLERDLARVERLYRRKGYYDAHARAGRVTKLPDGTIRVEIVVDEGRPVGIRKLDIVPRDYRLGSSANEVLALRRAMNDITAAQGEHRGPRRFDEDEYDELKKRLQRIMTDRGFAYAKVDGKVRIDLATYTADVVYQIEFGPLCKIGAITVRGLELRDAKGKVEERLSEAVIRTALGLERGQRYSTARLEEAEVALAELGIFASVEVRPVLTPKRGGAAASPASATPGAPPPDPAAAPASPTPASAAKEPRPTDVPIEVNLQPAKLRTVKLGIGAEVGRRVEGHLLAGWEDRNFFGGLRTASVEARPGAVFWPGVPPTGKLEQILPELVLDLRGRQPNFPMKRWATVGQASYEHKFRTPRLVRPESEGGLPSPCARDVVDNLLGYNRYVGRVGVERYFGRYRQHYLFPFSQTEINDPFSYNCDAPPDGYERVIVPTVQVEGYLDFRKNRAGKFDRIQPARGTYLGANVQYATDLWIGDAHDARVQPEVRLYFPLARRLTLAMRATTGVLLSFNYGQALAARAPSQGTQESDADFRTRQRAYQRDLQILELRGFFSGGPNSNRGYGFRGVGPQEVASFFSTTYDPTNENVARATGGRTLWETSLELRILFTKLFSSAVFLDASDVTRGVAEYRLTYPHLASGFGLRYLTPVGPLRGDLGLRVPCAQYLAAGCPDLPPEEGQTGDFLGLPLVVSVAIGEAF